MKFKSPYIRYVDTPSRNMRGEGAPRSTVFGVMGKTKMSPYQKSLGGLVERTADNRVQPGTVHKGHGMMTERDILGNVSKTHVNGKHFGQVLYAGVHMGHLGKEL